MVLSIISNLPTDCHIEVISKKYYIAKLSGTSLCKRFKFIYKCGMGEYVCIDSV